MVHHEVELRTRDIGVRMALGSSRSRVLREVVQRTAVWMLLGVGAGWVLTLLLERTLRSLLELDLRQGSLLLALLTAGLAAAGVMACLVPARRAASVNPMEALRAE
jgi:ABC-type antimicrobial peptide transport system permease subunit